MLGTKFQASESSGSKEKRFEKFSTYFYGSNPEHPGARLFWTLRPSFKQNRYKTTRQCY